MRFFASKNTSNSRIDGQCLHKFAIHVAFTVSMFWEFNLRGDIERLFEWDIKGV